MNCKQGDVAYVFKSKAGNYGKVVTCLRLAERKEHGFIAEAGLVWHVDQLINCIRTDGSFVKVPYIRDDALRPLRGDLSGDEIEQEQPLASALTA